MPRLGRTISCRWCGGRFRVGSLRTRQEAAEIQTKGERYLVDETTAVTRFIFPCEDAADAAHVSYFFHEMFVKGIIQVVNGEDEIWMVESGMRNRLHIWRVSELPEAAEDAEAEEEAA